MSEILITSWNHLQEVLFDSSWNPAISRYRSGHAFRGLDEASFTLTTTLTRLGGKYEELESHLIRNFKKYAQHTTSDVSFEPASIWHWLSLAQHHGLPTRLLDWTYSPYVALHFATRDMSKMSVDGAVWKVDFSYIHEHLPKAQKDTIKRHGATVFTVDMLAETLKDLSALDGLGSKDTNYAIFFEPPSFDSRIVNQFAYFSVLSDPTLSMDAWLLKHPACWHKIVIPGGDLKWEIRDKLDQCNISERVLFPGLDGLCAWLKRHYSTRP